MKKSVKRISGFVAVLLVLGFVLAGCGAPKKDLTGQWKLDTIALYGMTLKAENVTFNGTPMTEIGFDVKDESNVEFIQFSEIFDAAYRALLQEAGVTEAEIETAITDIKAGLEKAGIKADDILNYYKDMDTQNYELVQDKFNIISGDQTLLSGTLTDDNTIYVPDFCEQGLELTFVRAANH